LGATARGARSYLAVREGFQTAPVLGSRSTESPIGAGAALPAAESRTHARWPCPSWLDELSLFEHTLRVVDGPDSSAQPFIGCLGEAYEVGALSNRVGLRLTANTLPAAPLDPDRLSRPVSPGAVQWTGKELIVLGPACGTMGGYPHIANVISPDIPRLAQFRPGDRVRIEHLTLERAWQADRQHRATIERLSLIIRTMGAK
jgi:allophanate hydrolase subunit 2